MRKLSNWKMWLCASALAFVACDDDDEVDAPDAGGIVDASSPLDSSAPLDAAVVTPDSAAPVVPAADARYAVVTQVSVSGDQTTSYVSVVKSLASSTPVSLDGALQVVGRALAANEAGAGTVFVSTGGAPELTKYTLDAQDKLVAGGKISFQQQGVASIGEYATQLQFVSATKAYYFDTRSAQIIVWNPSTLTVTSTIDIKSLLAADTTLTFSSTLPVKKGSKIALAAGWRSSNNQRVIKQVGLVVLDTASDTATVLRDDRCGYVRDAVEGPDGRVYLATEAWGSSVHRLNAENAPAPCLLRTDANLTAFDTTFYKELNTIGGGVTGSLTKSVNGKVFTRVLDESKAGINEMTSARLLASLPAWNWKEVTLGDNPSAVAVAGAAIGTGSLVIIETKDKRFNAEIKENGTDLIDITNGVAGVSISTGGYTFSAAQIR